jgi:glycogen debranching enzyme
MQSLRTLGSALAIALGATIVGSQEPTSLADLRWSAGETKEGRFVVVPGERAFVGGYNTPGLEVWTYPLQLVHSYWVSFHVDGDTNEFDGRSLLRAIEHTPIAATRIYEGPDFRVRERIFVPTTAPAAWINYSVESRRPILITAHFTPSLNLMWPGGVGGQEIHWDSTHFAYTLDEPSRRFRGAIVVRHIVAHEQIQNNRRSGPFERSLAFTMRASPNPMGSATVSFAGASVPDDNPLVSATNLVGQSGADEGLARQRYAGMSVIDVETPDSTVNRALRWAQVTLEQAWVCNPQLGCGLVAGYGPSRGSRRPQYAWFFGNDGLVAVDALLREGAYTRARDELSFIMRYQNKRTGAIWHELSQSAGFLDWEHAYPYMFVHVDVSFDFLDTFRDYVVTTGDIAFAKKHWSSIRAAYDYCRATIPPGHTLPEIPAGQQGRDEQDPQRDELSLSLASVTAFASFATLARLTGHETLSAAAEGASRRARDAIRPAYYDTKRRVWLSGHLRSGAPVEGLTGGLIALLHQGLLSDAEQRALLDSLASSRYRAPWGIRSTPNDSPLYDPDAYARGSVWAIGTADATMAFFEAGRAETAAALWRDLVPWFALDAPGHMHEVLNGDVFAPERESVPDQSWSSAAFLSSAVRGVLGLRLDAAKRQLRFAPRLPKGWDTLRVRRLDLAGARVDLALRMSRNALELEIENSGPAMTLTFHPSLDAGVRVSSVDVSEGARLTADAHEEVAGEVRIVCVPHRTSRLTFRLATPQS